MAEDPHGWDVLVSSLAVWDINTDARRAWAFLVVQNLVRDDPEDRNGFLTIVQEEIGRGPITGPTVALRVAARLHCNWCGREVKRLPRSYGSDRQGEAGYNPAVVQTAAGLRTVERCAHPRYCHVPLGTVARNPLLAEIVGCVLPACRAAARAGQVERARGRLSVEIGSRHYNRRTREATWIEEPCYAGGLPRELGPRWEPGISMRSHQPCFRSIPCGTSTIVSGCVVNRRTTRP